MNTPHSMYGRLGTQRDVDAKIDDAMKIAKSNADYHEDFIQVVIERDTVQITVNCELALRAIKRAPDQWLVMYNPEYYPKPA